MPNHLYERAAGGCCDPFRKLLFFLFEIGEFDFDQFVEGQFLINTGNKGFADPLVSYFENWIEQLGFAFETAAVGGCKWGLQGEKMPGKREELKNGKGVNSEPRVYEANVSFTGFGNLCLVAGRFLPSGAGWNF